MFRQWEPPVPLLGQSRRDFLVAFTDTKAARCRFYFLLTKTERNYFVWSDFLPNHFRFLGFGSSAGAGSCSFAAGGVSFCAGAASFVAGSASSFALAGFSFDSFGVFS
jgi:hypothetical protein